MRLSFLLFAFASLLLVTSCTTDTDTQDDDMLFLEATIGSESYRVEGTNVTSEEFADNTAVIIGTKDRSQLGTADAVVISLTKGADVGTYAFSSNSDFNCYYQTDNENTFIQSTDDQGQVVITKRDGNKIEGTFDFIGINDDTNEETAISGSFRAEFGL